MPYNTIQCHTIRSDLFAKVNHRYYTYSELLVIASHHLIINNINPYFINKWFSLVLNISDGKLVFLIKSHFSKSRAPFAKILNY